MHAAAILCSAALLLPLSALAGPAEVDSGARDRQALALTLYHGDLAVVRDSRKVRMARGTVRLTFADLSAQIRPETAQLYGGLTVLEQNFDYERLTPRKLLDHFVGRAVGLVRIHPQTGEEKVERGTLLSVTDEGVVFRFGDRIETSEDSPWRFVFDEVPAGLGAQPTLSMLVESPAAAERTLELVYLTGSLSWRTDYVATLMESGNTLNLTGWATITNNSGVSFPDARLQFVAGDVNRVAEPFMEHQAPKSALQAMRAPMQQEGVFEYHLYSLERPTTIADGQTKQVLLLQGEQVPVDREYRIDATPASFDPFRGDQDLRAEVLLRFKNAAPALGKALPAGIMRFYRRDRTGGVQFIGENRIDHTPEGRELQLGLGSTFDITATRRQTDFRKGYKDEREAAWEVDVFNAKEVAVSVEVLASFPGEWKILEESLPHARHDAGTARWTLQVPSKSRARLTYRVSLR